MHVRGGENPRRVSQNREETPEQILTSRKVTDFSQVPRQAVRARVLRHCRSVVHTSDSLSLLRLAGDNPRPQGTLAIPRHAGAGATGRAVPRPRQAPWRGPFWCPVAKRPLPKDRQATRACPSTGRSVERWTNGQKGSAPLNSAGPCGTGTQIGGKNAQSGVAPRAWHRQNPVPSGQGAVLQNCAGATEPRPEPNPGCQPSNPEL
jgi:hypothetical protein